MAPDLVIRWITLLQGYNAKASCLDGVESVRRNTPSAIVVDTTMPRGVVQRVKHGLAWLLFFRLARAYHFGGSWWRDAMTGSDNREDLPEEPE